MPSTFTLNSRGFSYVMKRIAEDFDCNCPGHTVSLESLSYQGHTQINEELHTFGGHFRNSNTFVVSQKVARIK